MKQNSTTAKVWTVMSSAVQM